MERQICQNFSSSRIRESDTDADCIELLSSELRCLEIPDNGGSDPGESKKDSPFPANKAKGSCGECSKSIRVKNMSELKRGQHIEMPGPKMSQYDENEKKRNWWYTHHAIVTNIIARNDSKIELELIHMRGYGYSLSRTNEIYDLKYDELYVKHYYHPRYTHEEIASRAEIELTKVSSESTRGENFVSYDLLIRNCEHFATWCVVGDTETYESKHRIAKILDSITKWSYSRQVMECISFIVEGCIDLFGHGSKVMHFIMKLLHASSDEISKMLSRFIPNYVPSAQTTLAVTSSIYFLYCLINSLYLYHRKGNATICKHCYDEKIAEMWSKFSIYGITSAVTYYMFQGSLSIPIVLSSLSLILISVALQYYIPPIRKKLMAPYGCSKMGISRLHEIEIGDIVTIIYWGFPHDIIVTEIHPNKCKDKGKLRAVHYGTEGISSERTIREEYFDVNLASWISFLVWEIKRHECEHLQRFPPQLTIERARKRIGERKWHPITNRSDHLCYWAKISEPVLIKNDKIVPANVQGHTEPSLLSSWFIAENEVHLSKDIEVGDIIRHRKHEYFVLTKSGSERKIKIESACVNEKVKIEYLSIDLNTDSVQVLTYHPAHCNEKYTRAQCARNLVGKIMSVESFKERCLLKAV